MAMFTVGDEAVQLIPRIGEGGGGAITVPTATFEVAMEIDFPEVTFEMEVSE